MNTKIVKFNATASFAGFGKDEFHLILDSDEKDVSVLTEIPLSENLLVSPNFEFLQSNCHYERGTYRDATGDLRYLHQYTKNVSPAPLKELNFLLNS